MGIETIKALIDTVIGVVGFIAFWYLSELSERQYPCENSEMAAACKIICFGFAAYLVIHFAHFLAFLFMGV